MKENLTKKEIIKKSREFSKIFASDKRSTSGAKIFFSENGFEFSRFGITLKKNYGNAVQRNRAKRICREFIRKEKYMIKEGYDILFLIFPDDDTYKKRSGQFSLLLKKANLVKSD